MRTRASMHGRTPPPPTHAHARAGLAPSQARLLLELCCALGLQQVVLAGHADGCLVALRAASLLAT